MPFGGTDWLALTQESALEPEIPICDPGDRRCSPTSLTLLHSRRFPASRE